MYVFGKRLSALLMVMAVVILGVAMLPQAAGANTGERQRTFTPQQEAADTSDQESTDTSEQEATDASEEEAPNWRAVWAQNQAERHARGGPETPTDTPSQGTSSNPDDGRTPSDETTEPDGDGAAPGNDTGRGEGQDVPVPDVTTPGGDVGRGEGEDTTPGGDTTPDEGTTPPGDTTTPPDETTPPSSGSASLGSIESQVLSLINAHRQDNGLAPLSSNGALNTSAHNHSLDMAVNGFFSHTGSDGSSPFDRMRAAGYSCGTMGENIAAGQSSAQQVFNTWMNSPGHNENMLNPSFTDVGIGFVSAPDSRYGYYWTTNFGGC